MPRTDGSLAVTCRLVIASIRASVGMKDSGGTEEGSKFPSVSQTVLRLTVWMAVHICEDVAAIGGQGKYLS